MEIRETLNRFLVDHFKSAPPFIGNKLIKLVVDIARTDWPHFYPNFMNHALELARTPDSMRLGLSILLIASEELATPRDDLATGRKEELKKLLTAQAGQVSLKSKLSFLAIFQPRYQPCFRDILPDVKRVLHHSRICHGETKEGVELRGPHQHAPALSPTPAGWRRPAIAPVCIHDFPGPGRLSAEGGQQQAAGREDRRRIRGGQGDRGEVAAVRRRV